MKLVALLSMLVTAAASAQTPRLHFKPEGHSLGDVHPFFHAGECFLYYLKPGKYESMLVRSRDWLHWTPEALVHEPVRPDDWFAPYFVLGVFRDEAAQAWRSYHGHTQGRMACSVSADLFRWSCAPKEFAVPAADYYERRRDPFVFWIPEMKSYGCVMTTWAKGRPKETGGAVSLAISTDLQHWNDHGVVLDLVDRGEPECPQMFQIGTRWYLLTSIYARHSVGRPEYFTAARPQGPWAHGGVLDGKDLCAAQVARDGDEGTFMFGWIPLTPATPEKQEWGGHLALAREVYALPDGGLATRLPAKLARTFEALPWRSFDDARLAETPRAIPGAWRDFAAAMRIETTGPGGEVRLSFAPLGEVSLARDRLRILDGRGLCWSELALELDGRAPCGVLVFVEDDRVEVFAGDRWSLCARLPAVKGPYALSLRGADAAVSRLGCAALH
ncbi:MAG: hypothetical protein K1X78_19905 [Verrucomicrobiaceae bacterium]|nr:hypothetical protein [Verrucomicrobiaceae bacterium]